MRNHCRRRIFLLNLAVLLFIGCVSPGQRTTFAPVVAEVADSLAAEHAARPGPFLQALLSTEPGGAGGHGVADLETLRRWLGDARVVGLGESLHGVHDFHRFGHRLFEELAERGAFDVYALEIDQAHAAMLDQFVQGQRSDLEAILASRWWSAIFYDEALLELVHWMRAYNQTATRALHIAGFDIKQPDLAARAVVERLRAVDARAAEALVPLYGEVLALGGFGIFPNVSGMTATVSWLPPTAEPLGAVRIAVSFRGRGVTLGQVGLTVQGTNADGVEIARATKVLSPAEIGSDWTTLQIDYPPSTAAQQLRISVFHRGNGAVWFQGLEVQPGGAKVAAAVPLADAAIAPLLFPALQVQDYRVSLERDPNLGGVPVLQVECDRAVDRAFAALTEAEAILRASLDAHASELSFEASSWLAQLALAVRQAVEWRVLAEPNRDRFLARNVAWLQSTGFPGSRVLVLAHSVHIERISERMGDFLSAELKDHYRTVSLLALSGQYRYFGDPRKTGPASPLELYTIAEPDRGLLATELSKQLETSLDPSQPLGSVVQSVGNRMDVAVLLRRVTPLRPIP
jgi:erythromycin esterase-like protein